MSENTLDQRKITMLLGGAVVALLAAIVVILLMQRGSTPTVQQIEQQTPGAPAASTSPTQGMPGVAPSGGEFDAKTATKVESGSTPEKHVSAYYDAILDKKWDEAFKMQPKASQSGTVDDFKATQESYGMTKYNIASSKATGDELTVVVDQTMAQFGEWQVTWTFVKSGDGYVVKSRNVAMK